MLENYLLAVNLGFVVVGSLGTQAVVLVISQAVVLLAAVPTAFVVHFKFHIHVDVLLDHCIVVSVEVSKHHE